MLKDQKNRKWSSSLWRFLTSLSLQDFSSKEIDFHFCKFLSNFLRYSALNLLLSYSYNIFAIYFPGSSSFLESIYSTLSIFSCLLTSALSLLFCIFQVHFLFPDIVLYCKALLSNQVLHTSSHYSLVKDFLHFPLFFSVHCH